MRELQNQERSIFLRAVEFDSQEDIANYLKEACGDDESLREQVESLLAANRDGGDVFDQSDDGPTAVNHQFEPGLGMQIGPYKLREKIGEGGFGIVYVAEQQQPVFRKVALKMIKPGMDSKDIVARFEAERQALAMMDHPNVAKVLDAGTTPASSEGEALGGRPFFVMELVHGTSITKFCDEQQLSNQQRLQLFIDICRAVQHAHQKGVIHRDLKPSNIMVTMSDGKPLPKVIDFGVAKALHHRLSDKSIYTGYGQMVGTPAYMSPEQAQMSAHDVDTRSDVYSLGVLLYELLTGSTPFDKETFQKVDFDELRRIIREDTPPRPSDRVSTLNAHQLSTACDRRRVDRRALSQSLRGELDWIVMKALEKERNRRYETAGALADDIQRYLANEPVLASPPSNLYRFRKFAARNKVALGFSFTICAALLLVVVGLIVGIIMVSQERTATQQALEQSRRDGVITEAVLAFVENQILTAIRPRGLGGLGKEVTMRQAIEAAVPYLDRGLIADPEIEARLRTTLGHSFRTLALYKEAGTQFEIAHRIRRDRLGPEHEQTVGVAYNLARNHARLGKIDVALEIMEEMYELGSEMTGENGLEFLAELYSQIGHHEKSKKRSEEALQLRETALTQSKSSYGSDDPFTIEKMYELAVSYAKLKRHQESHKLSNETLSLMEVEFGRLDLRTINCLENVADQMWALGQRAEATPLYFDMLERREQAIDISDHEKLRSLDKVGLMLAKQGRFAEAEPYFGRALEGARRQLGNTHKDTLAAINNMAVLYWELGKLSAAEPLLSEALQRKRDELGHDHPLTISAIHNLGWVLLEHGNLEEAEPFLREAVERSLTNIQVGDDEMPTVNLAALLEAQGKHAEAYDLIRSVMETDDEFTTKAHRSEDYERQSFVLGRIQMRLGKYAEAENKLLEAYSSYAKTRGESHRYTTDCIRALVELYADWHAAEPTQGYDDKITEWQDKLNTNAAEQENKIRQ